jgi:prepilin-type N-terminal cleavage/methylation domain-containing protein
MRNRAFTLIEVLVSLAIFSGLFLALALILTTGKQIYSSVTNSILLRQNARNAMDRIVREVRESNASIVTSTTTDPPISTISFGGPRYKTPAGALCQIRYSLANGQILREYPPGTIKPVANSVTQLYFEKAGSQLKVQITVAKTVDHRLIEFTLVEKVRMRNE